MCCDAEHCGAGLVWGLDHFADERVVDGFGFEGWGGEGWEVFVEEGFEVFFWFGCYEVDEGCVGELGLVLVAVKGE